MQNLYNLSFTEFLNRCVTEDAMADTEIRQYVNNLFNSFKDKNDFLDVPHDIFTFKWRWARGKFGKEVENEAKSKKEEIPVMGRFEINGKEYMSKNTDHYALIKKKFPYIIYKLEYAEECIIKKVEELKDENDSAKEILEKYNSEKDIYRRGHLEENIRPGYLINSLDQMGFLKKLREQFIYKSDFDKFISELTGFKKGTIEKLTRYALADGEPTSGDKCDTPEAILYYENLKLKKGK